MKEHFGKDIKGRPEVEPTKSIDARKALYREAMSRLGATVSIITTSTPLGPVGFAASSVSSVTDDPATLLVCINRSSSAYAAFAGGRVLCVNLLSSKHESLSRAFGGAGQLSMEERFSQASWQPLVTGAPALEDAAASIDCSIEQVASVGTHDVLYCAVKEIRLSQDKSSLIYHNRSYHRIQCLDD